MLFYREKQHSDVGVCFFAVVITAKRIFALIFCTVSNNIHVKNVHFSQNIDFVLKNVDFDRKMC